MSRLLKSLSFLSMVVVLGMSTNGCSSPPPPPPGIQSEPVGAEVWIKRHGIKRAEGGVAGIGVEAEGTKFEEQEFIQVGLTPCDYRFPADEEEASVGVSGLGGSTVWKVFKGGTVQIRMPGYTTWERKVPFGNPGDRLMIDARLEKEGGGDAPADKGGGDKGADDKGGGK